jgi:hypothetical protein
MAIQPPTVRSGLTTSHGGCGHCAGTGACPHQNCSLCPGHGRPCSSCHGNAEEGRPDRGAHQVAVLSASVLRMVRWCCRESRTDLAVRAGVSRDVVDRAEDGTGPAWALPYADFAALSDAVAARTPRLRKLFETATACDLLLSCVLDGDQALATDVLAERDTRQQARALLNLALSRKSGGGPPLLGNAQVDMLRDRAAALAASGSPDAWVGAELCQIARRAS